LRDAAASLTGSCGPGKLRYDREDIARVDTIILGDERHISPPGVGQLLEQLLLEVLFGPVDRPAEEAGSEVREVRGCPDGAVLEEQGAIRLEAGLLPRWEKLVNRPARGAASANRAIERSLAQPGEEVCRRRRRAAGKGPSRGDNP